MQYKSKGKSCGYYMRIIFFFSSLIQSLIIVSLVLFLIYGKNQDSESLTSVPDLEKSFSQLSIENVALRNLRKNLTNLLNSTLTEKAKNDWDLANLRGLTNKSIQMFQNYEMHLQQCNMDLTSCRLKPGNIPSRITQLPGHCNCGILVQEMKARLDLLESNLTQTKQILTLEKEQIAKERDNLILQTISLRREKSTHEKELEAFRESSKDQFSQLLSSVSTVSKYLLEKIDSVFPRHIAFQLTCPKQREYLEQIQTNCTSLSREVENKLQQYMNNVGDQFSNMQIQNNHLKAENWRLTEDYRWCSQNRTGMMEQHKRSRVEVQQKHDQEKERLLMEKMKLAGEAEVLRNNVKYKDAAVDLLKEQLNLLNTSCISRNGFGQPGTFGGVGSTHSLTGYSSLGQGRTGTVGSGSSFSPGLGMNRGTSTGGSSSSTFSSSGSRSGLSNTGSGFNQKGSVGAGSLSSTLQQSVSSPSLAGVGSGVNKPTSTGGIFSNIGSFGSSLGSTGTGSMKPAESGRSSSTFGSSSMSFGSNLNQVSGGISSNKPTSSGKSSPGLGLGSSSASSESSGSAGKTTSSSFSWLGLGRSNTGQSKTGSVPGKTYPGSGNGGTGSVFGGGRTNGLAGGTAMAQHIQDLQRLINPPAPQEKQDLSRMLG